MAFRQLIKLTSVVGVGGYSTYVLQQNDWDVKNIGLVRFGRAAYTVGHIAFDYKRSVSHLKDDSDQTLQLWSQCHSRAATQLLKLCCDNGGAFIKVGQHIAALDYLVPKEYVDILKVLHNQGPRSKFSEIKEVIKKELGKNIEDIFDDFEEKPIGAASLAQVHKAKLKETGEIVAVKVQHPRVFKHSIVDIATMEVLFSAVTRLFPEFNFMWLADETRRNLPLELDFVNEGKNAEQMASMLEQFEWLKIPKIYWKWTTKRTLVMEFIEGKSIRDKEYFKANKINCSEISNRLVLIYSHMIFLNGNVHCDPHPGNLLITKKGTNDFNIVLLDHGLYTKLTNDFRRNYSFMWLAVLRGDVKEIERCAQNMGIDSKQAQMLSCMISAKPWSAIKRGLENVPDKLTQNKEKEELRENASRYMNTITQILSKMDRQLLLILKTNDLIRSICHVLGSDERRSFLVMSRSCIQVVQSDKLLHNKSALGRMYIRLQTQWLYFRLSLYSLYLWFGSYFASAAIDQQC